MRSRKSCRLGFTLVELLAVAGAVSLMGTQILDAIVQAREASRRQACKNNLKQIGLALHNYHDTHNGFPPGWVGGDSDTKEANVFGLNGVGWGLRICPFLEQTPLYNSTNFSLNVADKANVKVMSKAISRFRCPSDRFSGQTWEIKDAAGKVQGVVGASNYPGSFGTDDFDQCEKMKPGDTCEGDGILFHNSFVRLMDITDGSSNTIGAAERIMSEKADQLTTWTGVFPTAKSPFARILGTSGEKLGFTEQNPSGYSSRHQDGGVHTMMIDGSVRFREPHLSLKVLQALTTRSEGEEIPQE